MEWSGLIASSAGIGALVSAIVGPVVSYFLERRKIERQKEEDQRQKEEGMKPCYLGVAEALDDFVDKCKTEIDELWEWYECSNPQGEPACPRSYSRKSPDWEEKRIFYDDSLLANLPANFQSEMMNLSKSFFNSIYRIENKIINYNYHDDIDVVELYKQAYSFYGLEAIRASMEIRKSAGLSSRIDGGEFLEFSDYIKKKRDYHKKNKGDPYSECRILPELKG